MVPDALPEPGVERDFVRCPPRHLHGRHVPRIAAAAAFRDAAAKAGPTLLEPIMAVEVITPTVNLGDCIGDLNRRRGVIRSQESRNNGSVIEAHVPLKEMFGYIGHLRGMTSGRASYTMEFSHYDPVPRHVAEAVIAEVAKAKADAKKA